MADIKEIERRRILGLTAIKQAAVGSSYEVDLFTSHHLENVGPEYWQQHAGTLRPDRDQILNLLELRSHWGNNDEDGIDVFDFTLPGGITNYVIAVRFNDSGIPEEISMES